MAHVPSTSDRDREPDGDRGQRAFRDLFGALPHPDGLVIGDDILTRELLTAAVGAGVRVGQYLRIASHTNKGSPTLREWAGRLTAIEVDPDEIVEAMFGMLERLMDGEEVEQQTVIVKPRIRRD